MSIRFVRIYIIKTIELNLADINNLQSRSRNCDVKPRQAVVHAQIQ